MPNLLDAARERMLSRFKYKGKLIVLSSDPPGNIVNVWRERIYESINLRRAVEAQEGEECDG